MPLVNKNSRSKTPLKPKEPLKWVFMKSIPETPPQSFTSKTTFSNDYFIVDEHTRITTEEVMDK